MTGAGVTEIQTADRYGFGRPEIDERDQALLAQRIAAMDACPGPRVGDVVRFADGVTRRISYDWSEWDGGLQTSDSGSYHLSASGHVSMSGSLFGTVPAESLTESGETMQAPVWFFHHDQAKAHNGVDVMVAFRVFDCTLDAPR